MDELEVELNAELQALVDRVHPILWPVPAMQDKRMTLAVLYVQDFYETFYGTLPPLSREESLTITKATINLRGGPNMFDRVK